MTLWKEHMYWSIHMEGVSLVILIKFYLKAQFGLVIELFYHLSSTNKYFFILCIMVKYLWQIYIIKNRLKYIDDDGSGVLHKQLVRKKYNSRYQKTYSNHYYVLKNDYIKDTRMCRTYSGNKWKSTGYVLITGSIYHDAKGSPQHRSCLHDAIINAAPIIGGEIDQSELYIQCSPRRVKDTGS